MKKIKVALIDDHNVLRQSLVKTLNAEFDLEVTGHWPRAEDLLESFDKYKFDVLIMDLKLPGINGFEATRRVIELKKDARIIVLSAFQEEKDITQAIEAGVMGYLPKEATIEELANAIREVNQGNAALDPSVTRKVLNRFTSLTKQVEDPRKLNETEIDILKLASKGESNKAISKLLDLKDSSVKYYFREILKKLDARDRAHAVAIALKQELIS